MEWLLPETDSLDKYNVSIHIISLLDIIACDPALSLCSCAAYFPVAYKPMLGNSIGDPVSKKKQLSSG